MQTEKLSKFDMHVCYISMITDSRLELKVTDGVNGERAMLKSPVVNISNTQCAIIHYNRRYRANQTPSELTIYEGKESYALFGLIKASTEVSKRGSDSVQSSRNDKGSLYVTLEKGPRQLWFQGTLGDVSSELHINQVELKDGSCYKSLQGTSDIMHQKKVPPTLA